MHKKLLDLSLLWLFVILCGVITWVLVFYGMPWPDHRLTQSWRWFTSFATVVITIFIAGFAAGDLYNKYK